MNKWGYEYEVDHYHEYIHQSLSDRRKFYRDMDKKMKLPGIYIVTSRGTCYRSEFDLPTSVVKKLGLTPKESCVTVNWEYSADGKEAVFHVKKASPRLVEKYKKELSRPDYMYKEWSVYKDD